MAKPKIEKSQKELWRLVRYAFSAFAPALAIVFAFEHFGAFHGASIGFVIGYTLAVGNVVLLGYSLAPLLHYGEKRRRAIVGGISSIVFLAGVSMAVAVFYPAHLLGLSIGFASPALFGVLYAVMRSKY